MNNATAELQAADVSFLTKKEVANLLRVDERTIDRYRRLGVIKSKRVGLKILFEKKDVFSCVEDLPAKEAEPNE